MYSLCVLNKEAIYLSIIIVMKENTSILVTGCAGFIGSNICDELLLKWHTVIGIDNFSTWHQKNIEQALAHKSFSFIEQDITDLPWLQKVFQEYSISHISHQAARWSVSKSVENPLLTNNININWTLHLLRLAKKYEIKKFVCAISSSIYGNTTTLPKIESMPYKPESPYAITKACKEMYCKTFFDLYWLPTIGLRYFNVYGKRQDPQWPYAAVIPRRVLKAINNEDLPLNGAWTQTRDFTYIDDVVHANVQALFCTNEEAYGKWYNVSYWAQTSIKNLWENIVKYTSSNATLVSSPARAGDISDSLGDISLAKKFLQYQPQTDIDEWIVKTIQRYKENTNYFT